MESKHAISVVIPVFNEVESLPPLVERLVSALDSLGPYEVVFVNDGSQDGSESVLDAFTQQYPGRIRVVHLGTNCGKSIAPQTGFEAASNDLIVMMDADLQDQPEEIHKLVRHLEEKGLDVVTGWKADRHDPISKTLPSRLFNRILRRFSGLDIHDFNCGLKAMRSECVERLSLYGQLHRFMLILLASYGFKVGELPVEHSPRLYGHSKYRARRFYEGLMDFLTVFFITRYLQSPLYFFGFYGIFCFVASVVYGGFFIVLHLISLVADYPQGSLNEHPIWILSPVMFLIGLIFIFFGLLGELYYHLTANRLGRKYVKRRVGFENQDRSSPVARNRDIQ